MKLRLPTLATLATITLLALASCHGEEEEKEAEVTYLVTSPIQVDTSTTEDYVAQIKSIRHIELRTQERGFLQKIFIDEGQFVRKGQLLFQIMPSLYNAEVQKAQAEANYAQIEYKNTKGLADSNIVSSSELALSRAKLSKAQAELSLAQVHRSFTEIRAPFDGIVDKFNLKLGSLVDEGELLTSLSDNSEMWVYFNVPEAAYLDFKTSKQQKSDMKVQLLMANNQLFNYPGVVEAIEADFNNETGNISFRATFPNPESLLRNGETGAIQMLVPLKNAVLIPQKATFEVLDKKYVFVVDKDKKVHTREIKIVAEMEDVFAVSSGLKKDEMILLEGIKKVKDNDKISFKYEEPNKVMANLKEHAE